MNVRQCLNTAWEVTFPAENSPVLQEAVENSLIPVIQILEGTQQRITATYSICLQANFTVSSYINILHEPPYEPPC